MVSPHPLRIYPVGFLKVSCYINDLPNISKILNFYLFADDTDIYYENENLAQNGKDN